MPTRHGGRLAKRASTWPRDHFCRNTMAPRSSWPTMWKEFLPISMPTTAIAALSVWDMACTLSLAPLASFYRWRGRSTAGPSHYRAKGWFPLCWPLHSRSHGPPEGGRSGIELRSERRARLHHVSPARQRVGAEAAVGEGARDRIVVI